MKEKHWSRVEYLHLTVKNPNIEIKGQHSYYSDSWDQGFEKSVVRYLHGDTISQEWVRLGIQIGLLSEIMFVLRLKLSY